MEWLLMKDHDERINLGLIGCGGMGNSHLNSLIRLKTEGLDFFNLLSVCDLTEEKATSFSEAAFKGLGYRPKVYTSFEEMLTQESEIEAADVVTDHRSHHTIVTACLERDMHVMVEKPLGITIRACRKMIDTAEKFHRILAVAENYRRTPRNRALKKTIDLGVIGTPYMLFQMGIGGGDEIVATAWRHLKEVAGAGWILDMGVHEADLFRYFLGEVEEVYGLAKKFEKRRFRRVSDESGTRIVENMEPTVEDTFLSTLKFRNGLIGQWSLSLAGHTWPLGYFQGGFNSQLIYGSKGHLNNGNLVLDNGVKMDEENLAKAFMILLTKEEKERLFPRGITDGVALELFDFAKAIIEDKKPEVDGWEGLRSEAVCYTVCESAQLGEPVKVKDVEESRIDLYQRELDENLKLV